MQWNLFQAIWLLGSTGLQESQLRSNGAVVKPKYIDVEVVDQHSCEQCGFGRGYRGRRGWNNSDACFDISSRHYGDYRVQLTQMTQEHTFLEENPTLERASTFLLQENGSLQRQTLSGKRTPKREHQWLPHVKQVPLALLLGKEEDPGLTLLFCYDPVSKQLLP
jgi:hypothetical protein